MEKKFWSQIFALVAQLSRSVLRWMSVVRNPEILNIVLLSTFGLLLTCFVLKFFISMVCVWLEKTTVLFICKHKWVKSIVFAVKFCDESGLAILRNMVQGSHASSEYQLFSFEYVVKLLGLNSANNWVFIKLFPLFKPKVC